MVTILVAGVLSLVLQQEIATTSIVERSQISTVAVLLPLAAGAAGAINLVQSERSSLVSGAATGMLVAASLAFSNPPELERASRAQRANAAIQDVIQHEQLADLVEANICFTQPSIPGQNTLLCVVYVQRAKGVTVPSEEIRFRLTKAIQTHLRSRRFNVTPLVDVSVLEPPDSNS